MKVTLSAMTRRKSIARIVLFSAVLAFLLVAALRYSLLGGDITRQVRIVVRGDGGEEKICLWLDDDGMLRGFLPGCMESGGAQLEINTLNRVYLDGTELTDGYDMTAVAMDTVHILRVGNEEHPMILCRTGNAPAMYIDTRTGTMDGIRAEKDNKETVSIRVYDADGASLYRRADFKDEIKGHGNSTWELEKKPYKLKLKKKTSLLGMEAADEWILLANATDETNLRNKIVYDIAGGMDFRWTPRCEYMELFLNGKYEGLYLLAEKVEPDRLQFSEDNLVFFRGNQRIKWKNEELGFTTEKKRDVELLSPENPSGAQWDDFRSRVQHMETVLLHGEKGSENLFDLIDCESWARRYLVDEVFLNFDAEQASAYYYYSPEGDGRIYAGPIWDYDLSLGNVNNYWSKYYGMPNRLMSRQRTWYGGLTRWSAFNEKCREIYTREMLPALQQMRDGGIDALHSSIEKALAADELRWAGRLAASAPSRQDAFEQMKDFLSRRMEFLNDYWFGSGKWREVRIRDGEFAYRYMIPANSVFDQFPDEAAFPGFYGWYNEKTGEAFDASQPITENTVLIAKCSPAENSKPSAPEIPADWNKFAKYGTSAVLFLCFGIGGLTLVYADRKRSGKSRR